MPKMLVTGAGGLFTSVSDFVKPPNAMAEATNVILRDAGIIEQRRGMIVRDHALPFGGATPSIFSVYGNTLFHKGLFLYYDTGTTWANADTATTTGLRGKVLNSSVQTSAAIEFLQNFYAAGTGGLYMTDAVGTQMFKAGFDTPPPVIVDATVPLHSDVGIHDGDGAWIWIGHYDAALAKNIPTAGSVGKIAYRVVWGRKDAHERIFYSEPSGRVTLKNDTGLVKYVTGDVPTVPECSSSVFYQVFRSFVVDQTDPSIQPSDNMYQVYEGMGADVLTLTGGSTAKAVKAGGGSSVVTVTKTAHGYRVGMKILPAFAAGDMGAGKFYAGSPYTVFTIATVADANTFTYDDTLVNAGTAYTNLSSATITPKFFPFLDASPDLILAVPLYTNPNDSPDPMPNSLPPAACDITQWKNRMWFANTNRKHMFTIHLVGVKDGTGDGTSKGSPDGLSADDTITIDGMAFVAKASPTSGGLQFLLAQGNDPSTNIIKTAASLITTINNYTGNTTIRAFDGSGDNGAPGIVRLERINQYDASFAVTVARSGSSPFVAAKAWAPYIPNGATSKNDNFINRLYFSKVNQPEAVPALNYIDVGSGSKNILRIVAVKENLFIFKEDGIFQLTGDYPFRLDLMDQKTVLTGFYAISGGESSVYGLFNSGVCRVDSTGVRIISSPVASDFRQLSDSASLPLLSALNETDGIFLLQVFVEGSSTPVWHCYNIRTNAWTRADFETGKYSFGDSYGVNAAFYYRTTASKLAKLVFAFYKGIETTYFAKETRLNDPDNYNLQYIDGDFTEATTTCVDGVTGLTYGVSGDILLSGAFSGGVTVHVGDIIYSGPLLNLETEPTSASFFGLVTSVLANNSFTIKQIGVKAAGTIADAATVRLLRAYTARASYCVNNPMSSRHYRDVTYMFEHFDINAPTTIITTDQNGTEVNSPILFTDSTVSNTSDTRFKRVLFPAGHQFCNAVTVGIKNWEAGTWFHFLGVGLCYEDVSERNSR